MRLDGNAAAGALEGVLPFDVTLAVLTCATCRTVRELGGSPAYLQAPGVVVRCAGCESVLLRFAADPAGRLWLDLSGCSSVQVQAGA